MLVPSPSVQGERAVAARGGTLSGGGTALTCQVTALGDASVVSRVAAQDADHRHHPGRYKCSERGIVAPDCSCLVHSSVHITNGYTFQLCGGFFKGKTVFCGILPTALTEMSVLIPGVTESIGTTQNMKHGQQCIAATVGSASRVCHEEPWVEGTCLDPQQDLLNAQTLGRPCAASNRPGNASWR